MTKYSDSRWQVKSIVDKCWYDVEDTSGWWGTKTSKSSTDIRIQYKCPVTFRLVREDKDGNIIVI